MEPMMSFELIATSDGGPASEDSTVLFTRGVSTMNFCKRAILFFSFICLGLSFIVAGAPKGIARGNRGTSGSSMRNVADSSKFLSGVPLSSVGVVCHISRDFVSLIDLRSNQVLDTIEAGKGPDWAALSPDRKTLYVADFNSNDVSLISMESGRKYSSVPAGLHPSCICPTADGATLLVSHQSQDGLWFMDTKTQKITGRIPEGTGPVYFLRSQDKFYQPAIFRPFIHIINLRGQSMAKSVWVGGRPMAMAFTPDGKRAYIPNYDLAEVQVFDTQLDTIVKAIPDSDARGVAVTPDGKYALVTNVTSNTLTVIATGSDTIAKVIGLDRMPTDVAVSEDGKYAYVTNQGAGSISVVDVSRLEVVAHIEVADNPISIFIF
jgi:YVTN family beta-propeller protein